ncbi:hypothetical protein LCGC14_0452180 [marine sediment metagenome]|uniref:Uncharacterized protein n=1 Tax=marine sediment metagenome TaxID=412755 RepID=A0A0F9T0S7_9ZZZZ
MENKLEKLVENFIKGSFKYVNQIGNEIKTRDDMSCVGAHFMGLAQRLVVTSCSMLRPTIRAGTIEKFCGHVMDELEEIESIAKRKASQNGK